MLVLPAIQRDTSKHTEQIPAAEGQVRYGFEAAGQHREHALGCDDPGGDEGSRAGGEAASVVPVEDGREDVELIWRISTRCWSA